MLNDYDSEVFIRCLLPVKLLGIISFPSYKLGYIAQYESPIVDMSHNFLFFAKKI